MSRIDNETAAKNLFEERLRHGDGLSKIVIAAGACLAIFPALSVTGFFFESLAALPQPVLLLISAAGSLAFFCLYYTDRSFWYVGIPSGLITGPLAFFATTMYTSGRESIWTFEFAIPLLLAGLPGWLLWYFPLRTLAVRKLHAQIDLGEIRPPEPPEEDEEDDEDEE